MLLPVFKDVGKQIRKYFACKTFEGLFQKALDEWSIAEHAQDGVGKANISIVSQWSHFEQWENPKTSKNIAVVLHNDTKGKEQS